ncbi:O-antigen polymerase [Rossellomorea aquimaris]|uniref:Oligosaccharide repeat unit polymerase n=1 Tax=Rossellomorea aquimaris TaxID=189382 RepID=A0A5D4U7C8_9BACI|nr:O-antigen polymerase [Rossellomorea aquimaris]TYS76409.1 oligosaccharide repeat unit polymerase [Rossellomorea aquimaris]TYS82999.1 oligosaccharide repeat unit polymerase [Rossellomorea aquimaris]
MSSALGILQLVLIILIILYEYKKKSIMIFLWGTLFILFGVPHILEVLFRSSGYTIQTLNTASIFVIFFNILYIITRLILSKNKVIEIMNDEDKRENKKLIQLLLVTFIGSVLMLYISNYVFFGKIFGVSWGEYININREFGLINPFKISLYLFFATAGVGLIFYKYSKKMYILVLGIILIYSLTTGNRITILPLLISIIYPFLYNKKVKLTSVLHLVIFGMLTVYIVYFLRLIRIYGGFGKMLETKSLVELNSQVMSMLLSGEGELSLKNAFYFFIENNNNFPNFLEGHTYLRILLMPFPTSYTFGLKPPDFTISMGSAYISNFNNNSYSMHPTLYGDIFGNFGIIGLVTSIIFAIILIFFNKRVTEIKYSNRTFYFPIFVLSSTMLVIIGRGSVYNGVFYFVIGLLILKLLNLITKFKLKRY